MNIKFHLWRGLVAYGKFLRFCARRTWFFFFPRPPFRQVGAAWNDGSGKPIALLWGFSRWKHDYTVAALPEYRCGFIRRKAKWRAIQRALETGMLANESVAFFGWSDQLPAAARAYAAQNNVAAYQVEDGFLRSLTSAEKRTKPMSLAFDRSGIYFDARQASDLENLIADESHMNDPAFLAEATAALALARAGRLTKYYDPLTSHPTAALPAADARYRILVLGQVEGDASIRYGCTSPLTNLDALRQAKADFPDAHIYYRPHPDVWHGNRKALCTMAEAEALATIVPLDTSLHALFPLVDHVYTITSLAGFEALWYGTKVTTLGAPFYAGWGLTDDRQPNPRRQAKRTLEQVFGAAYLHYPRYIHPMNDQKVDYFAIASYFIVEKAKYALPGQFSELGLDIDAIKPFADRVSKPLRLLLHLRDVPTGEADSETVLSLVTPHEWGDAPQILKLLYTYKQYNALAAYLNHVLPDINNAPAKLALLKPLIGELLHVLRDMRGRKVRSMPDMLPLLKQLPPEMEMLKYYIRLLAVRNEYASLESLLHYAETAPALRTNPSIMRNICASLHAFSGWSETDAPRRERLIRHAADLYRQRLDAKAVLPVDRLFHKGLQCVQLWDLEGLAAVGRELHAYLQVKRNATVALRLSIKRSSHLIEIIQNLVSGGYYTEARALLVIYARYASARQAKKNTFMMHALMGDFAKVKELSQTLPEALLADPGVVSRKAMICRVTHDFEGALESYRLLEKISRNIAQRNAVDIEISRLEFCRRTSEIINAVPQPETPRGVVFVAAHRCFNTLAMMAPVMIELKRMGYAVVHLTEGMLINMPTGNPVIDQFAGCLSGNRIEEKWVYDWNFDWHNKRVTAGGINFYQGFYEKLSNVGICRRYHPDTASLRMRKYIWNTMKISDRVLALTEQIHRAVVQEAGLPVTFISGGTHVAPYSITRDYCMQKNDPKLGFINCNIAYENYFSNLGKKYASTFCVTDMTLYPETRAPFLARRDQFERWYEEHQHDPAYLESTSKLLTVNRNSATDDQAAQALTRYLAEQRAQGKKILCAFGKVPVDLGVPYDGGPAHEDMADWLNHTIDICRGRDDVILLIKPHPHELRPEIALDLAQGFTDLIEGELTENIRILGHREINVHALVPYLDLALLYNGSSGLELTAQGIPVMMAAHFGRHDYPVDLLYPESRAQYAAFLTGGDYPLPSEELRKKAAFLIAYMGTKEIAIQNDYSLRPVTNDHVGAPRWREDRIAEFLAHGDPGIRLAAERIVEKFERSPAILKDVA